MSGLYGPISRPYLSPVLRPIYRISGIVLAKYRAWIRAYLSPCRPRFRPKYVERVRCIGYVQTPDLAIWAHIQALE